MRREAEHVIAYDRFLHSSVFLQEDADQVKELCEDGHEKVIVRQQSSSLWQLFVHDHFTAGWTNRQRGADIRTRKQRGDRQNSGEGHRTSHEM